VAHPSKTARKTRNRRKTSAQGQLLAANAKNQKLAGLAVATYNQSAHLAKLLAYVVANYGHKGVLRIPDGRLAEMPDEAKLRETYDQDTGDVVLTSVIVNAASAIDHDAEIESGTVLADVTAASKILRA
jgi:hypothetical protein